MIPARPTTVVLALAAGRVAGFVLSATRAVHDASSATFQRIRNPSKMLLRRNASHRFCSRNFVGGGQEASTLWYRCPVNFTGTAFRGRGVDPQQAARLSSVREQLSMAAEHSHQRGGPLPGGYPPPEHLNGVFAVYKPKGFTSNDVVQKIKRILTNGLQQEFLANLARERVLNAREKEASAETSAETAPAAVDRDDGQALAKGEDELDSAAETTTKKKKGWKKPRRRKPGPKVKVGHGGTLDPMATGVLVIGVGKGCRELGNFLQGSKSYRAEALFGHETDTQDAEGEATLHGGWEHVTKEAVDAALGQFVGDIKQVPPMFSALSKDGKRLYELARQGITVEREARQVTVYSLRQTNPTLPLPSLGLELECGGGFYVRTLIEDLARALGSRAHLTALERTKQGPFEVEDAVPQPEWEYELLCTYLGDTTEMMRRLALLEERDQAANDSASPAVPARTMAAAVVDG